MAVGIGTRRVGVNSTLTYYKNQILIPDSTNLDGAVGSPGSKDPDGKLKHNLECPTQILFRQCAAFIYRNVCPLVSVD